MALFTPGTRGEKGTPAAGFMVQVIGLCCQLGGVITIVDAGQADIVMPALNFANFSAQQNAAKKTKVAPAAPAEPKQKV